MQIESSVTLLPVGEQGIQEWKRLDRKGGIVAWLVAWAVLVLAALTWLTFVVWFMGWGQHMVREWWPWPMVWPRSWSALFGALTFVPLVVGAAAIMAILAAEATIEDNAESLPRRRRAFLDARGLTDVPEDAVGLEGDKFTYVLTP